MTSTGAGFRWETPLQTYAYSPPRCHALPRETPPLTQIFHLPSFPNNNNNNNNIINNIIIIIIINNNVVQIQNQLTITPSLGAWTAEWVDPRTLLVTLTDVEGGALLKDEPYAAWWGRNEVWIRLTQFPQLPQSPQSLQSNRIRT